MNAVIDTTCSVGIGKGLSVFGSVEATMQAARLFLGRDRAGDAKLPGNSGREGERDGLGIETMSIGRGADGEPLVVTGNSDAMGRMQAIFLADARRVH